MTEAAPPPVLEVEGLSKHFPVRKGLLRRTVGHVYAVDDVSFTIGAGETLGLVGESGCGKTTVGRTIMRLIEPTAGAIRLDGHDVTRLGKSEMRPFRRQIQIIFQDPFSSLNPRKRAGDIVGEPLKVHGVLAAKARRERVAELFERVGLRKAQMDNFPHQFSGGQRQRIGVARALALNPRLIIGDEPVSALDVSIQAQVINLLMDLQRELKLSYLFISHNLAVVEHIAHRVAVMYLGRIVEYTDKTTLFTRPLHPYTEALLAAVPVPDPAIKRAKRVVQGDVPSPLKPPPGCHFHTRCPYAEARCRQESPGPARGRARPPRGVSPALSVLPGADAQRNRTPAGSVGSSTLTHRVDGVAAGAECEQHQQAAGDGEVLLEVQHLVAIGKIDVKEQGRDHAEDRERECGEARLPADHQQDPAAQLESDHQRQQRARHGEVLHVGDGRRVASHLAPALEEEQGGQQQPPQQCRARASGVARHGPKPQLVLGAPPGASAIAFSRSSSSSQPCGHSLRSRTTCSRAFASSPRST